MTFPDISTPDGRRAFSFLAIVGGSMVFTVFAAVGVWLVHDQPGFAFWLALAAHAQVFTGMTALGWMMGRRMLGKATRDGIEFDDRDNS